MTYELAYVFTKIGNLLPYYEENERFVASENLRQYYARERVLQLILLVRFDRTGSEVRKMCRIKCPVNPLPIKGEFEVVSISRMVKFLTSYGWVLNDKFHKSMFDA